LAMACEPSAPNPARFPLSWWRRPMHRCSEPIGAIAAALARPRASLPTPKSP
jgi:hypothetical protein